MVLCCFGTLTAQTTLTFTGKDNLDNYVQLHHVVVENLTQNWADTLYYPDTILILSGAGLNDYENVSAFSLSQNVPNPFDGVTDFTMALPCEDKVVIEVFDMAGKRVTGTTQRLSAGKHTFRVWLNRPQAYLLSVKTGRDVLSIKMVNRGGRNDDRIAYLQESPLTYELKSARDGDHPFAPGDTMRYTGYALHDSSFVQSATIEQPVHEDELFELAFHLWEFVEQDGHFIDTNTLFIPDGQPCNGSCLGSMHFQVSGYPFGQTVQSEEDIQFLRLKMEHSYMGDLWISLSCPNGQSATLLKRYSYNSTSGCSNEVSAANSGWQQEGFGKAKLGQYNTDDGYDKCDPTLNPMGTCWNYCWSCDTSHYYVYTCGSAYLYDTCNLIAAGNNIYYVDSTDMASMTNVFRPDESFSSLIGCPLNGLWKVNIVDSWSLDNGYVEEAEIALPTFSEYLAAHKPTVVTGSSGSISYYTAVCGGDVLDDGFLPVTARGICWDTIPEPTTAGPHTVEGTGKGNFASTLANLEAGTTYHFRAYAVNDLGTSYGVTKYGYLYTLTTAGRSTFCPPGWHLPSKADWDTLFSYVGSQTQYRCGGSSANIAKALASTTGWSTGDYSSVGGCAPAGLQVTNNETGFTAMPAGELLYFIGDEGVTEENSDFGTMASFWSGTAKYIHVGSFTFLEGYHYFWLTCNSATTHNDVCGASEARSARCVRNQ